MPGKKKKRPPYKTPKGAVEALNKRPCVYHGDKRDKIAQAAIVAEIRGMQLSQYGG